MLQELYAGAAQEAAARELEIPLSVLERIASLAAAPLNPRKYLLSPTNVRVIAEIKRASPSRGVMAKIDDPGSLASIYQDAGAGAVSVLTESKGFLGSLEDLDRVRSSVQIPVLRKDFISNEYQVIEARAHGADMVLLIVAGLDRKVLAQLKLYIEELGMTALVETHSKDEVRIACDIGADLIGINTRDLNTFETDRSLFGELATLIPKGSIRVAESSVRDVIDVQDYASNGADCVLVGEALVTGNAADLISSFNEVLKP